MWMAFYNHDMPMQICRGQVLLMRFGGGQASWFGLNRILLMVVYIPWQNGA